VGLAFTLLTQNAALGIALDTTSLSLKPEQYASTVANRQKSSGTSKDETLNVFEEHKDLFTQDAWLGMQRYEYQLRKNL
jgi:hypothetical protein